MRLALVSNPRSGAGTPAVRVAEALEGAGATVERFELDRVKAAAASGADRLVIASGDGCVALAAHAAAEAGVPFAVVPTGTANDFAARMELPADFEEACRLAARGSRTVPVDIGLLGERPFVNLVSMGLSVAAAIRAHRLKPRLGPLAYAVAAARVAVVTRPLRGRALCDGDELFAGAAWLLMVANSGAFGGGAEIEAADPGDRRLDVTVVPAGRRWRLALYGFGLRSGRITGQPDVLHCRAREAVLDAGGAGAGAANVDGEVVRAPSFTVTLAPRQAELVVA